MKSIEYKGYIIESVERKGRTVYRVANSEGKYLINRPKYGMNKFEYGSLEKMFTQFALRKLGLFVDINDKRRPSAITQQLSIEDCKQCIDDVIAGEYKS